MLSLYLLQFLNTNTHTKLIETITSPLSLCSSSYLSIYLLYKYISYNHSIETSTARHEKNFNGEIYIKKKSSNNLLIFIVFTAFFRLL